MNVRSGPGSTYKIIETIDSDRKPYSWLSHANAERIKGDLLGPGSGSCPRDLKCG